MYVYERAIYVCICISQPCSLPELIAPTGREYGRMWTFIKAGSFPK